MAPSAIESGMKRMLGRSNLVSIGYNGYTVYPSMNHRDSKPHLPVPKLSDVQQDLPRIDCLRYLIDLESPARRGAARQQIRMPQYLRGAISWFHCIFEPRRLAGDEP